MTDIPGVQALYAQLAARYERDVIPAFGPLADNLAAWVGQCLAARAEFEYVDPFDMGDRIAIPPPAPGYRIALDLGTGTGILARALARSVGRIIGVDLSPAMLNVARRESPANVSFAIADIHRLPFRRGQINLVVSSFGLNASTPKSAFRSVAGLLRPGDGVFAFQEWGAQDECSTLINDILNDYAPDDLPGLDETLRNFHTAPKPWYDRLQYEEDYVDLLKQVGFELVYVKEAPFVTVHLPSMDDFIASKLVWPLRVHMLGAMTPDTRGAFYEDVRAKTRRFANPDGSFDWKPPLFRVFAVR